MKQGFQLGAMCGGAFVKQLGSKIELRCEVLERPGIVKQALSLTRSLLFPLLYELYDEPDIEWVGSAASLPDVDHARRHPSGKVGRDDYLSSRPPQHSIDPIFFRVSPHGPRPDNEEVEVEHFTHQLAYLRRAAIQLRFQLPIEVALALVWPVQEPLPQLPKPSARPDSIARREERVDQLEALNRPTSARLRRPSPLSCVSFCCPSRSPWAGLWSLGVSILVCGMVGYKPQAADPAAALSCDASVDRG